MQVTKLLAAVCCLGAAGFAQNIVVNPGFEAGAFAPWVASTYGGLLGGLVWTDSLTIFGQGPHSGRYFATTGCNLAACIGPDSGTGAWLYQDLATVSGSSYTLSFYFAPGTGASGAELQVLWGATSVPLTIGAGGSCGGNCVYRSTAVGTATYSLVTVPNLMATSTSMRLEFLGEQQPSVNGIDDVCVGTGSTCLPAAVPAMPVWALAVLAALLLASGLFLTRGRLRRV